MGTHGLSGSGDKAELGLSFAKAVICEKDFLIAETQSANVVEEVFEMLIDIDKNVLFGRVVHRLKRDELTTLKTGVRIFVVLRNRSVGGDSLEVGRILWHVA